MTAKVLIGALLTLCMAGPLAAGDVRCGAASANIEADDSMVIAGGIGPGKATGQEGQLRSVAVVLEKPGAGKVAIVACDVLFVTRDFVDAALDQIAKSTGIPASNVLVNATHTHHAPCTATVHGYVRDDTFTKRVQDAIVRSVEDANARLNDGDSEFLFKLGQENTVGANSRMLLSDNTIWWGGSMDDSLRHTGPFDPQLPVLAFRGPDQKLRALLYNHSTHTIGARKPGVRSPSFYGLAAQELEGELGCTVSFLEGASGSTHNITGVPVDEAVRRMKKAIQEALAEAKPHAVTRLVSVKRPFQFKVRTFDETVEDEKVASYTRKRMAAGADSIIEVFRNMRRQLKSEQGKTRDTMLHAILIGDVAIVGVPAEYFTIFGVDIKRRSPFPNTYVAELANDWIGYLPNREAHELGGYQTWMGLHSYAEVGTGERVADNVVQMLEELARP
jgi:neutral ceramidase